MNTQRQDRRIWRRRNHANGRVCGHRRDGWGRSTVTGIIIGILCLLAEPPVWAETIQYTYDTMGRVTRATYGAEQMLTYTYDTMDNRQTYTRTGDVSDEGLVAFYPFEEGAGTTTADASGRGHDGTLVNTVAWTTNGIAGNALSFDGVDDYVLVPDHDDLDLTEAFTLAAWVNTDLSQFGTLLSKDGVG